MIGNKYLRSLFQHPDQDTAINQLLELLQAKDAKFMDSLYKPEDIAACSEEEIIFLTIVSALIDYWLQIHDMDVPPWLRDTRLILDKPYFHAKKLSDFDQVQWQYACPAPFKARNVYFDMDGLERV